MRLITVSLVEDEPRTARMLIDLLRGTAGFAFCQHYPTAEDALARLPAEKPGVVLVDLKLPGLSGVECIRRLKRTLPDLLCLVVTQFDDTDLLFAALQAGADGYLLKRAHPAEILDAIRTVDEGGGMMSPSICRKILDYFQKLPPSPDARAALSPREIDLLQLARRGKRPKDIASALGLSYATVRSHFRNIYSKLHVHSFQEAVDRTFPEASRPSA